MAGKKKNMKGKDKKGGMGKGDGKGIMMPDMPMKGGGKKGNKGGK